MIELEEGVGRRESPVARSGMSRSELARMVDALAERLGRSVAIDDPEMRLVYVSRHFGDEDAARVQAVLQRNPSRAVAGHILSQGVARWTQPGMIPGRADIGMSERLCVPLRWRGTLVGLLMVIGPEDAVNTRQLDAIMGSGRDMAAQMYRERAGDDQQRVAREQALWELLSVRPARRRVGRRIFEEAGWPDARGGIVTASVLEVLRTEPRVEPAEAEVALRAVMESMTHGTDWRGACAASKRQGVLLRSSCRRPTTAELRERGAELVSGVEEFLGRPGCCVVGIGAPSEGLRHAWTSHDQANVAARGAALLPGLGGVASWAELGSYGLLLRIPPALLTEAALPEPLRILAERDPHGRLRETLACYLDHAGSSPATAAALHIHRTSLYYRLHRVEEITGLDLGDGDHRLQLHLGLRLAALIEARSED